jgi:hypothetical protein
MTDKVVPFERDEIPFEEARQSAFKILQSSEEHFRNAVHAAEVMRELTTKEAHVEAFMQGGFNWLAEEMVAHAEKRKEIYDELHDLLRGFRMPS